MCDWWWRRGHRVFFKSGGFSTASPTPQLQPTSPLNALAATIEQEAPHTYTARSERLGALRYRDFRYLLFGQAVSAIGSWMQLVALGWLVYSLTGSAFYLGLIGLARAVPVLAFTLVGGAVADRYDRRTVMALANGAVAILAFAMGVLTWSGLIAVWQVVAIAFLLGVAFSFEMPSRQSLVSHVVAPKDVVNAVGLNSVAFNSAQILGPALAAVLIETIGEGGVFLLNGATSLAVVLTALLIRPVPSDGGGGGGILANMLVGLRYVRRTPELFALVASMAVISLLARPYIQLLPAFARDVLDVGASGLGALNSASGVGAVVGSMLVAMFGSYRGRGLALMLSGATFGVALVVFSLSTNFTLSLVASGAIGLLSAFTGISSNTMLQTYSKPRLRGRVVSLHGLTMMGVVPLGVMLEGALGSLIGVPLVVMIGGALTALVALGTVLLVPRVRRLE
ncbi:MAG TPA: MFS transporter [Chloroflexota bacterium]|nr:MFS transporter [Chloroflexota bacterium]